ncbi:DUF3919 family protein [Paenibacillus sp. UMB4589-SE434]|uniref:DUF3919 family protein n=1 Tax=Paenibacillus sp. UMB4589-SE434 TaxID=3046314 RepID=UPI00254B1A09|nr:DUF3919 family protein [Paenibacillus sp. UMB4589-SE434]MDK8183746.1 DUF3919 family protein [Paenibacillus sp. UMB4589-SE434]
MNKLIWSFLLFAGFILLLSGIGYVLNDRMYENVVIIEDRNEVLRKVSDSLPVQATIVHDQWGVVQVTDEVSLHAIISYIDRIKQEYDPTTGSARVNEQAVITGRIQYLNGDEQPFALGDDFTLNQWFYGPGHKTPMLSAFQTQLLNLFYTPEHYADFIRDAQDVTYRVNKAEAAIHLHEKGYLVTQIRQAHEIVDMVEIKQLLLQKQEPLGTITAFKHGNSLRNSRNDLLHAVVYPDFIVMQYMGDDNGNSIYLQSSLGKLFESKKAKADIR